MLVNVQDLLAVSVGDVSFMFMFNSLGGLVGCALIGVLFDRFKRLSARMIHSYINITFNLINNLH